MKCEQLNCTNTASTFCVGVNSGLIFIRCDNCVGRILRIEGKSRFQRFHSYEDLQVYLIKERL